MNVTAKKSNKIPPFLIKHGCIPGDEDRYVQMDQFLLCLYGKDSPNVQTLQAHNLLDPDNIDGKTFKQNFFRVTPRYIRNSMVNHNWHNTDCWTTVNTFKDDTHGRYSGLVENINGFFIDIDFHSLPTDDIRQAVIMAKIRIFNAILHGIIPVPTMMCRSGRGYHLYYLYKSPVAAADKIRSRLHDVMYGLIIDHFDKTFEGLDIDRKIMDRSRVCRVPGTLNTHIGELCALIYYNGPYYSQDDLIDRFRLDTSYAVVTAEIKENRKKIQEKKNGRSAKKNAGSVKHTPKKGALQLEKALPDNVIPMRKALMIRKGYDITVSGIFQLTEYRNRKMNGNRHYAVHLVYTLSLGAGHSEEYSKDKAFELNSMFTDPLSENEAYGCMNHTTQDIFNKPYYGYKRETAYDRLGLTDEENNVLKIDKERLVKANRMAAEERNRKICELRASGVKYKDISAETGTPERTVKDICRKYGLRKKDHNNIVDMSRYCRYARKKVQTYNYKKNERGVRGEVVSFVKNENPLYGVVEPLDFADDIQVRQDILTALKNMENICIQGSGGTGKTYIVKQYIASLPEEEQERVAFLAPTGAAAYTLNNKCGRTIHSFLGINEKCGAVLRPDFSAAVGVRNLQGYDRVIIDEISMCRVDLFYVFMRTIKQAELEWNHHIQVIVIGDFGQLQPVVKTAELSLLRELYSGYQHGYVFESQAWEDADFRVFILTKPQRFSDSVFGSVCYRLEHGIDKQMCVDYLNSLDHTEDEDTVYICGTQASVNAINNRFASRVPDEQKKSYFCKDKHTGVCGYIGLAVGMPVVSTENNKYGLKNGRRGTVTKLYLDGVQVLFDGDSDPIRVRAKKTGLPLTLGYAVTVHKSQGCTFDKVNIVIDQVFAPAQVYVSISRCRSSQGIHMLGRKLTVRDIITSPALKEIDERKDSVIGE